MSDVFTKTELQRRLEDLTISAKSINTLSMWLIKHSIHFQAIVRIWFKKLVDACKDKKLTFLYLADDVLQKSRRECPDFVIEFGDHMGIVLEHLVTVNLDGKNNCMVVKLIKTWRNRKLFEEKRQINLEKIWKEGITFWLCDDENSLKRTETLTSAHPDSPPLKQLKRDNVKSQNSNQLSEEIILPPHLTCTECKDLLNDPVQLPCCGTSVCRLCAALKLAQHNGCWFAFCPKSSPGYGTTMTVDQCIVCPALFSQIAFWKIQSNNKCNQVLEDEEPVKNEDNKEYIEAEIPKCEKIKYSMAKCDGNLSVIPISEYGMKSDTVKQVSLSQVEREGNALFDNQSDDPESDKGLKSDFASIGKVRLTPIVIEKISDVKLVGPLQVYREEPTELNCGSAEPQVPEKEGNCEFENQEYIQTLSASVPGVIQTSYNLYHDQGTACNGYQWVDHEKSKRNWEESVDMFLKEKGGYDQNIINGQGRKSNVQDRKQRTEETERKEEERRSKEGLALLISKKLLISSLKKEQEALQEKVGAQGKELEDIKGKYMASQKEIKRFEKEIKEKDLENNRLSMASVITKTAFRKITDVQGKELEDIKGKYMACWKQTKQLEKKIQDMNLENNILSVASAKLKEEKKALHQFRIDQKLRIEELQTEKGDLETKVGGQGKELEDIKVKYIASLKETKQLQKEIKEKDLENNRLSLALVTDSSLTAKLKKEKEDLEENLDGLLKNIKVKYMASQEETKRFEKKIKEKDLENNRLKIVDEQLMASWKKTNLLEKEIQDKKIENNKLSVALAKLKEEKKSLHKFRIDQKKRIEELQEEKNEAKGFFQIALAKHQQEITDTISKSSTEGEIIKKELFETKKALLTKEKELRQLKKDLEGNNENLNKLKNNNVQLRQIGHKFREKITLLETQNNKISEDKITLDLAMIALKKEMKKLEENRKLKSSIQGELKAQESKSLISQCAFENMTASDEIRSESEIKVRKNIVEFKNKEFQSEGNTIYDINSNILSNDPFAMDTDTLSSPLNSEIPKRMHSSSNLDGEDRQWKRRKGCETRKNKQNSTIYAMDTDTLYSPLNSEISKRMHSSSNLDEEDRHWKRRKGCETQKNKQIRVLIEKKGMTTPVEIREEVIKITSGTRDGREEIKTSSATRGEGIKITSATRGLEIMTSSATIGDEIKPSSTTRGKEIKITSATRGEEIKITSATRGEEIKITSATRGVEINSTSATRGEKIKINSATRGEEIKTSSATKVAVIPNSGKIFNRANSSSSIKDINKDENLKLKPTKEQIRDQVEIPGKTAVKMSPDEEQDIGRGERQAKPKKQIVMNKAKDTGTLQQPDIRQIDCYRFLSSSTVIPTIPKVQVNRHSRWLLSLSNQQHHS